MADMYADMWLDGCEWDEDVGWFNPWGGRINRDIKCKYCGRRGFHWKQYENVWRLSSPTTGRIHSCKAYKEKNKMDTTNIQFLCNKCNVSVGNMYWYVDGKYLCSKCVNKHDTYFNFDDRFKVALERIAKDGMEQPRSVTVKIAREALGVK